MGMTVQELIDELQKVEDKSAVINVIEGDADNDSVYEINDIEWYGDYVPSDEFYETYEEALEAGLKHGLESVKK